MIWVNANLGAFVGLLFIGTILFAILIWVVCFFVSGDYKIVQRAIKSNKTIKQ